MFGKFSSIVQQAQCPSVSCLDLIEVLGLYGVTSLIPFTTMRKPHKQSVSQCTPGTQREI